ncbi:MFS transporter [Pseudomonas sp. NPDC086251]|jgi:D-galactonate transporter|uniref:MFS transporter n=1 Tax=Pseudomonas sp. NPDC086251 TaxID=3364431 RepID=UPI0038354199
MTSLNTVEQTASARHLDLAESTFKKIMWRFMPLLFLCYVVSYLDRINVGFAKLTMLNDLSFSNAVYGLGAGIFFIGYFFAEVPSNMILHRVGARRWIARIMITWSLISAATALVQTPLQFYVLRFLLGIAEAGFFPGIVLYLTLWFPAHRRGKMVALLMAGNPVSGILSGLVSGYILHTMNAVHGLAGWQWLFIIEAAPALILGVVVLYFLTDKVDDAQWLNTAEKTLVAEEIKQDNSNKTHSSVRQGLLGGRVWLMCGILFLLVMGTSTIGFWQPSIISNSGITDPRMIGLISAVPYVAALLGMYLAGRSSDRRRERRWHAVIPLLVAVPGFLICAFFPSTPWLAIIGLIIATAGIITSLPMFWALPTSFLGGAGAAAGIALINSTGNLASFAGPALLGWLKDLTQSMTSGLVIVSICVFVSAMIIVLFVPAKMVNR